MHYQPYFTLQLFHSYYPENRCPDVSIEPTPACQRLLQGHRLVLKPRVDGVTLLVPLETPPPQQQPQQPVVALAPSLRFTFLLQLKQPNLISFTQLDPKFQAGRSFYVFSNETLKAPGTLDLRPTLVQRAALAQPTANQSALEARCAAILATLPPHHRQTLFGLVEIHNHRSLAADFSQPSHFRIPFAAKQQVWAYYLVINQGTPDTAYSIKDKSAAVRFETVAIEPRDRIITAIQDRFPNSQSILLKSTQPIPCQQVARPQLQLLKQGHTQPWIPHLPNPPNQHGTQVINLLVEL
ncbi:MAG: hypothetical protein AAF921_00900 [Cyanobacteria bacterium P01_D01_bin.44]